MVRAVEAAAALRAAGYSWAYIADELGRRPETVRQWPRQYSDVWARVTAETRRDLVLEAGAEAVTVLRNLLRSEDDRMRREAARELAHLKAETQPADVPTARSPLHTLADYLGGLSDEQLRHMLDKEVDQVRRAAPDAPPHPETV
jgi:predicted transcriptional regulator